MLVKTGYGEIMDLDYVHQPERWDWTVNCGECGGAKKQVFYRLRGGCAGQRYEHLFASLDMQPVAEEYNKFVNWLRSGGVGIYEFPEIAKGVPGNA